MQRIYLDNAATSWPKPEGVLAALDDYHRRLGAPAGRGVYREAIETERLIAEARRRIAELLGVGQPQRILFTGGCTDALNLALHGVLKPGDHVITTVTEHNSVLRPLSFLASTKQVEVTHVGCDGAGLVHPDDVRAAITPRTRLIALNHVSNVTGAIQPAAAIGKIAAEHGLLFLLDAAQSLGHLPVLAKETGAHFIAAPGHKGLLGPLGIGFLYVAAGVEQSLVPLRQGGTGTRSEDDRQPESLPDRYESGTHNVPGIIGLAAGVTHVQKAGLAARQHLHTLTAQLLTGLADVPGVALYGPRDAQRQLGVVSVTIKGFDPHEAATALDTAYRIQARPGIQCAPRMHGALGTLKNGGTLRFSFSLATTAAEIDAAIRAVGEIAVSAIA
jgi:cysteine desulfurase/selenocysteine lyase